MDDDLRQISKVDTLNEPYTPVPSTSHVPKWRHQVPFQYTSEGTEEEFVSHKERWDTTDLNSFPTNPWHFDLHLTYILTGKTKEFTYKNNNDTMLVHDIRK